MADEPIVHIGENSPEQVAYKLFIAIAYAEDKGPQRAGAGVLLKNADREWILNTYAECLDTVQNPNTRAGR